MLLGSLSRSYRILSLSCLSCESACDHTFIILSSFLTDQQLLSCLQSKHTSSAAEYGAEGRLHLKSELHLDLVCDLFDANRFP